MPGTGSRVMLSCMSVDPCALPPDAGRGASAPMVSRTRSGLMRRARAGGGALALLAGLVLGLAALPAAAQLPPPEAGTAAAAPQPPAVNFTQRGVPAEATAENGVLAREKALAAGRRAAWQRVLTEAGASGPSLSDSQIEDMVSSIVIEEERTSPTRYSGRITVNFNAGRARRALGRSAPSSGTAQAGAASGAASGTGDPAAPAGPAPISNWIEVIANYGSMAEWLDLMQRLRAAAPVGSVAIQAIATDAARLRLGLRAPPREAASGLAEAGLAMGPALGAPPGELWHLGLGGGG
ncbi:hypothetical protein [Roseicella aquatilis]|uniref:hypothetical protein n=1 Tax=Roseicella aquatilis TaxID=2527868 RepID=UPI001F0E884F|nr:hypothetical protein [Roseicella aquatilis]